MSDILTCKTCGWTGVSKEHAKGPCIPMLDEFETASELDHLIGRKIDTPIGVGVVTFHSRNNNGYGFSSVRVRLYCAEKDCCRYITGFLGAGSYYFEAKGDSCDLRNQEYRCEAHSSMDPAEL